MSRKDQLNRSEIEAIQKDLVKLCQKYDMEFGVLIIQGEGPLEIFETMKEPHWRPITHGIKTLVKNFADHLRNVIAEQN